MGIDRWIDDGDCWKMNEKYTSCIARVESLWKATSIWFFKPSIILRILYFLQGGGEASSQSVRLCYITFFDIINLTIVRKRAEIYFKNIIVNAFAQIAIS